MQAPAILFAVDVRTSIKCDVCEEAETIHLDGEDAPGIPTYIAEWSAEGWEIITMPDGRPGVGCPTCSRASHSQATSQVEA